MDFLVSASSIVSHGVIAAGLGFLASRTCLTVAKLCQARLCAAGVGLPAFRFATARQSFGSHRLCSVRHLYGRLGFCFSLLVIDSTWLGFLLLTRFFCQPDSALLALDPLRLDLPLLLRSMTQSGFVLLICSMAAWVCQCLWWTLPFWVLCCLCEVPLGSISWC